MFPNKPKYHQILPFFWFLFVFGCYLTLKSRTIEWVKKSSLQYPSEGSAASSPGLFPFSKGKPWERGWGVEILDIIGTERGSSSESRLCLIWIQLFQRCHYGHVKFAYTVLGLFLWRSQLGLAWLLSCFLMMFSLWFHEKAGWLAAILTWLSHRMSKGHLLLRISHFYLCSRPTKQIVNGSACTIEL